MEKIRKQIGINVGIIILSIIVMFICKSVYGKGFMPYRYYIGTDFIFLMLTSLATTVGWRFVEAIEVHWIYNLFSYGLLIIYGYEYGMSLLTNEEVFLQIIEISSAIFLIVYFIENIIIYNYFGKTLVNEKDEVGYHKTGDYQ